MFNSSSSHHNSNLLEELPYLSSYYQLPSPLIYNGFDDLGNFLDHNELGIIQQGGSEAYYSSLVMDDFPVFETCNKKGSTSESNQNKETRSSNKRSKIRTANGLRDPRMRLPLKVARSFFELQDMLGYDRASRTIEWLLIQSKPAIDEKLKSKSGEILLGEVTKYTSSSMGKKSLKGKKVLTKCVTKDMNRAKERKRRTTKESRKEAREKARVRTLEKIQRREIFTNLER